MEKIIKRSIIVISIVIVIILSLILVIKISKNNKEEQAIDSEFQEAEKIKIEDVEVETMTYRYIYSNDVMNKILNYIAETEKNVKNEEALVNLLDKDFIQKNNITEENVINVLKEYKDISSYFSKEIYKREISQGQDINSCYYYIKGIARRNSKEEYIYVLMKQDLINNTYSISFLTEDEYNKKPGANQEILIQQNLYNKRYSKRINDYDTCYAFLNDYINTVKNNPEIAYNLLDIEYRQKRFGGLNNYIEHINSVKNRLSKSVLVEYKIDRGDEITQYMCVDQTGNYYIFEKTQMMNYDVILDTYTLDLPIFKERYENVNTMLRGRYNIEECFEAINNKDYSYVYNKLNEVFKNNNYQTLEQFTQEMNKKLFEGNKINISYNNNEGDIYIYDLNITDSNNSDNSIKMEIIMKLINSSNFEMSFSFKE